MRDTKRFTIYADLHLGGPTPVPNIKENLEFGPNVVYVGDIWELKNILGEDIMNQLEESGNFVVKCKKTGTIYIVGNHEVKVGREYGIYHQVVDGILFIHGHRLSYSEKKIKKWENRKVGIGKWGLKFIKFKNGKYKESKKKEPSNKIKEKCLQLCKTYNCHTIVYGHTHNTWDGMYLGIRIVNVGRGKTTKLL